MNELTLALRGLLAGRRTGLLAVLTLALGLGGCMIVYSLLHDVFLKPLPYAQPDSLVRVWESNKERNWQAVNAAPANFLDWRERTESFTDFAAFGAHPASTVMTGEEEPRLLKAGFVTGNIFDVLNVRPLLGRTTTWEETWRDAAPVVVLSHSLWKTVFNADPDVVGKSVQFDGTPFQVIGVMPESFFIGPRESDLWVPYRWQRDSVSAAWFRRAHFIEVVGRLRNGVSPADAQADLRRVAAQLREEHPQLNKAMDNGLTPLHESMTSELSGSMSVLFSAVLLVLLIACVNVSGLLLARGISRQHLYSVQAALGATRARLLRGPLGEAFLVCAAGGLLGAVIAYGGLRVVTGLWPTAVRYGVDNVMDVSVFVAALLLVTVCGLLTGLIPALRAGGASPAEALMQGGRGMVGKRRAGTLRRWLLGFQMTGTLLLLSVAIAAFSGFQMLIEKDPGLATDDRHAFRLVLPDGSYASEAAVVQAQRELLGLLESQPGIHSAQMVSDLPFADDSWSSDFAIEGRGREEFGIELEHREVTPGLFQQLDIPMLRGEGFDEHASAGQPLQVVVNESFARRYFPDENPLGKRMSFDRYPDESSKWRTIVGVVADFQQNNLHEAVKPEAYESLWQVSDSDPYIVVHSGLPANALRDSLREVLRRLDPGLPLQDLVPVQQYIDHSVAQARLVSVVLAAFGLVAVALSCVGLYAAVNFEINSRLTEIGLRQALGADQRRLFGWLAAEWRPAIAVAMLAGLAPGMLAASRIDSWLGEIGGNYLAALLLATGFVFLLTLVTGWSGGRRAASVEPVEALRAE